MDNKYALLFIRGERPVKDLKYDIRTHPDIRLTADGKGETFMHGRDTLSVGSVGITDNYDITLQELNINETDYELLSEEDMEALFYEEEL